MKVSGSKKRGSTKDLTAGILTFLGVLYRRVQRILGKPTSGSQYTFGLLASLHFLGGLLWTRTKGLGNTQLSHTVTKLLHLKKIQISHGLKYKAL